eukprot:scaffold3205_cov688-Prasinococcus_capsulatus_cf.AAC.8
MGQCSRPGSARMGSGSLSHDARPTPVRKKGQYTHIFSHHWTRSRERARRAVRCRSGERVPRPCVRASCAAA